MLKFIELTRGEERRPVYVNIEHIHDFIQNDNEHIGWAECSVCGDNGIVQQVCETPEQVLEKIKSATADDSIDNMSIDEIVEYLKRERGIKCVWRKNVFKN